MERAERAWSPGAVLFDLDGTLVDTVPDLARSVDEMLLSLGAAARGERAVQAWIGNGVEVLVRRALAGAPGSEAAEIAEADAHRVFDERYRANNGRYSRVYPGADSALEHLEALGIPLACVTNKPSAFTRPLLDQLGLLGRFQAVVCGDDVPQGKPDPAALVSAVRRLGATVADALFVGDSVNDVLAARAAGMSVVCVSYGYNHGRDIRAAAPDRVLDSLAELVGIVSRPSPS